MSMFWFSLRRRAAQMLVFFVFGLIAAEAQAAALDGNTYAVVAPTFRAAGGAESYLRLFNGTSATSTFTVQVVGTPNGTTYGTATYQVPKNAAIQKSLTNILSDSASGALRNGDTGYSLYLRDPDVGTGYQHVIYSSVTTLFENATTCRTTLNQAMGALYNKAVLISVHTSKLAGGQYPSTVVIHNYRPVDVNYHVSVAEELSGNTICPPGQTNPTTCGLNVDVGPNATKAMDFQSFFETSLGWTPTSTQVHAIVTVTDPSINAPPNAVVTQTIRNAALQGGIDMSGACSINPVTTPTSAVSTSAPTYFDGTLAGSGGQSGALSVIINPNSVALSAPASVERAAAVVERPQTVATVTGTLRLANSSTVITLTGTYDSLTSALTLSGGGYTFTGSVSGNSLTGSYTAPGGNTGGFNGVPSSAGATASTYCGSYTTNNGVDTGTFTVTVSSTGRASGTAHSSDPTDTPTTVSGTVTAGSITATTSGGAQVSGSVTNTTILGTFVNAEGQGGTYSGNLCSVPR